MTAQKWRFAMMKRLLSLVSTGKYKQTPISPNYYSSLLPDQYQLQIASVC